MPIASGPASGVWKGDQVSYRGAHSRVSRKRGKPDRCERCGGSGPGRCYQWANLTGRYHDPADYERMCVPCHKAFDRDRREQQPALSPGGDA